MKSKSSSNSTSGGVGILGLLGVLFVGLKLTGYIDWSWWYVTMPFWGALAVFIVIAAICLFVWLLTRLLSAKR